MAVESLWWSFIYYLLNSFIKDNFNRPRKKRPLFLISARVHFSGAGKKNWSGCKNSSWTFQLLSQPPTRLKTNPRLGWNVFVLLYIVIPSERKNHCWIALKLKFLDKKNKKGPRARIHFQIPINEKQFINFSWPNICRSHSKWIC